MLLPSAFYVLLRYTAVTKVTTLVKQNYSQKYHRISIIFCKKSCRFYWIFDLFLIYIIVAILLIINDLSIYIMSKVKSQFPTGNFYLRGGKDGNGVIHIRYFINGRYVHKSTGIKIDPKMWDVKSQKIKGSNNPRINNIANQKNLILEEYKN